MPPPTSLTTTAAADADDDDGDFTSVHWSHPQQPPPPSSASAPPAADPLADPPLEQDHDAAAAGGDSTAGPSSGATHDDDNDAGADEAHGHGWVGVRVVDYKKELENGKESYVSYGLRTKTNLLATYPVQDVKVRRRFQDFTFLSDQLVKDFPACIVPPLPSKSRIEYLPGRDRFAPEFIEKRIEELQRFLTRLTLHPILRRAQLLVYFLTATSDWAVKKHKHLAATAAGAPSVLEQLGDSLVHLTQGTKARKVDERFEALREEVERFEFGLAGMERGTGRLRGRTSDLGKDYEDLARSVRQLGTLESGMTDPLNAFSDRLEAFSDVLSHLSSSPLPPLQAHLHSLQGYAQASHALLALRAQKQLDVDVLTEYLSSVVLERDRLAALVEGGGGGGGGRAGAVGPPVGVGAWAREKVERLRGKDDVHSRRVRMGVLDTKIAELQDAVLSTHQTSERFSAATLAEHDAFGAIKQAEMKTLLGGLVDGQIEVYRRALEDWEGVIPRLEGLRV